MEYVIKNHKNVYIRLNNNGHPVTCSEKEKTLFEYSKAKNILNSLPKTLRRLQFKVEAIPDIPTIEGNAQNESRIIVKQNYKVPDSVTAWIEKFGICDDILKEAQKRKEELNRELSNTDKEFVNLVHEIELEEKVDLYKGWIERNRIKENRERRRCIKDELFIISSVLQMDFRKLDRDEINKIVVGLANRKFKFRIIEEGDFNDM